MSALRECLANAASAGASAMDSGNLEARGSFEDDLVACAGEEGRFEMSTTFTSTLLTAAAQGDADANVSSAAVDGVGAADVLSSAAEAFLANVSTAAFSADGEGSSQPSRFGYGGVDLDVGFLVAFAVLAVGLLGLRHLHELLFRPLNRIRPHHAVGFEHLRDTYGKARSAKEKAALVNWVNRRKVIGDLPPVFPNGWFAILDGDSLPKESARHVQALGENFAVFRNSEGVVHVLDAYCPHLGANLAIGGKVRGNCLECPFHGWKFDGDSGKCVSIPYSTGDPPPQAKVKSWPCKEELGFIMVWYHAEGLDPHWEFPGVEGVSDGKYAFCGRSEHYISTHIQDMPENGADIAHLNVLHQPGLPAGSDLRDSDSALGQIFSHSWSAEWALGEQSHTTNIVVKHICKLFNRQLTVMDMVSKITQVGPGVVILRFDSVFGLGKGVLLQTVTPVEPLLQKVVHRFYFSNSIFKVFGKLLLISENIMLERDIAVWNSKKFMKNPILVREDKLIRRYRRWFSEFYSENSPTLESILRRESLDW